jgi:hypothetical protein
MTDSGDSIHRTMVVEERVMSNIEPQRPLPQSTVQLAHATSDAVITGLGKSPYLLGLIVLTAIGVGAAVYFLNLLISGQQQHLKALLDVQSRQQTEIVTLHKQEFDALLDLASRQAFPPSLIAPGSPALTQPPAAPQRGQR